LPIPYILSSYGFRNFLRGKKLFQKLKFWNSLDYPKLKGNIIGKAVTGSTVMGRRRIFPGNRFPIRPSIPPPLLVAPPLTKGRGLSAGSGGIPPQKLQIISHNFHFRAVLAVLFPAILPEFSLYSHHFSLHQILIKGFSLSAPEYDIKKIRLVHPLFPGFFPAVNGNGKFTDSLAIGGVFKLRVPG
jgi:hypothetical protein